MGKKRRPTEEFKAQDSTDSGDDCDTAVSRVNCPHVKRAININVIRKSLKTNGLLTHCKRCTASVEGGGGGGEPQTLWLCLKCGTQLCSRAKNEHALQHALTPHTDAHTLAIDTSTYDMWCYECNVQVPPRSPKMLVDLVELLKKMREELTASQTKKLAIELQAKADALLPPIVPAADTCTGVKRESFAKIGNNDSNHNVQPERRYAVLGPIKTALAVPPPPPPPTVRRTRLRGLKNLGNTCYFNSVLQCLAQTPFLLEVLDQMSKPGESFTVPGGVIEFDEQRLELPAISGRLGAGGTITTALADTLRSIREGGGVYIPQKLHQEVHTKSRYLCDGSQHDAQELLRQLLEFVRSDDLRRYQRVVLKEIGYENQQTVTPEMRVKCKSYGDKMSENILRPDQVFRGYLVSTLTCKECLNSKSQHEHFMDVSVPVLTEKPLPPNRRRDSPDEANGGLPCGRPQPTQHAITKSRLKREKAKERKPKRLISKQSGKQKRHLSHSNVDDNDYEQREEIHHGELQLTDVFGMGSASASTDSTASTINVADLEPVSMLQSDADNETKPSDGVKNVDCSPTKNGVDGQSSTSLENTEKDSMDDDDSGIAAGEDGSSNGNGNGSGSSNGNEKVENCDRNNKSGFAFTDILVETAVINTNSDRINKNVVSSSPPALSNEISSSFADDADNSEDSGDDDDDEDEDEEANLCEPFNRLGLQATDRPTDWSHILAPRRYSDNVSTISVQSCLNNFTQLELMAGCNKVECQHCMKVNAKPGATELESVKTNSTKQMLISSPPAVLILHFKRFTQTVRGFATKLSAHIDFPLLLDVAPYCASRVRDLPTVGYDQKKIIYALYGVVVHLGSLGGGHYEAYIKVREPLTPDDKRWKFIPYITKPQLVELSEKCKSESTGNDGEDVKAPPGNWYKVSDSHYMECSEAEVLRAHAYLLFYERIY